jgi:hypothetical protein
MNEWLIANLEKRLDRMRRLATIAHDREVIDLVKQNALEIEEDLKRLRGEALHDQASSPGAAGSF